MLYSRFCICMLHEQFTRWLTKLHKIILAHHDEHCECDCGFCVSCGDLDSLSIGGFMRLMLCPPSLRFHGSTIPLFDWNCIDDKYVCFLSLFRVFNFYWYWYWMVFCFLCLSCSTVATSVTLTSLRVFSNAQYITLVVRRRGGRIYILDVQTCWSHWTISYKCSYWLNYARCAAHPTVSLFLVNTVPLTTSSQLPPSW